MNTRNSTVTAVLAVIAGYVALGASILVFLNRERRIIGTRYRHGVIELITEQNG